MLRCSNLFSLPRHTLNTTHTPAKGDIFPEYDVTTILALPLAAYTLPFGPFHHFAPIRNPDGGPAHRVTVDAGCAIDRIPSFKTTWCELTTPYGLPSPGRHRRCRQTEVLTVEQGSITESTSTTYSLSPPISTSRPAVLEVVEM